MHALLSTLTLLSEGKHLDNASATFIEAIITTSIGGEVTGIHPMHVLLILYAALANRAEVSKPVSIFTL